MQDWERESCGTEPRGQEHRAEVRVRRQREVQFREEQGLTGRGDTREE